jgi:O-antigen/teichoic acid export membrane protein
MKLNKIYQILIYSNLGNFFSFLFLILIARILDDDHFSLVTSLVALATSIAYVFCFVVPFISNEISKKYTQDKIKSIYIDFIKKNIILFIGLLIFFFLTKKYLFFYFKFESHSILFFITLIIFFNILIYIQIGFLSGLKLFLEQNKFFSIQHFVKIAILGLLFLINYNLDYVFFSIALSMLIFIFYANQLIVKNYSLIKQQKKKILFKNDNLISSLLLSIIGSILIYSDIIISRKIFSPELSSQYNIFSSLSKINYYFLSSLILTIVPIFKKNNQSTKEYFLKLIYIFLIFFSISNIFYYYFTSDFIYYLFNKEITDMNIVMIKINSSSIIYTATLMFLNYLFLIEGSKFFFKILIFLIIYLFFLLNLDDLLNYSNTLLLFNFLLLIFIILSVIKRKI